MEVKCRFDEDRFVLNVYNDCYGGGTPRLNQEALIYFESMAGSKSERLLLALEKYGVGAVKYQNGIALTRFGICLCPKECSEFYRTHEYDGRENPYIDNNEYLKYEKRICKAKPYYFYCSS